LTGTKGLAAKESIDINKSLFVLRKVIMGLSESSKGQSKDKTFVPYRDSKLTSLLKQSIGGNAYCLMIACIAPSDRFFDENVITLSYATRASNISNAPTKNIDPKIKEIQELKSKNKALMLELASANKHIEFLTSMTSEQLQVFGDSSSPEKSADIDLSYRKLDTSSPMKPTEKVMSMNSAVIPKFGSKTSSKALSVKVSPGITEYVSGVSTDSQTKFNQMSLKKSARGKSKDLFLSVEKRESIEDISKSKLVYIITNVFKLSYFYIIL
jgi:hypothetical protein